MAKVPKKIVSVITPKQDTKAPRGILRASSLKEEELLYYGVHACQALFKNRKNDIVRVYCTEEVLEKFGALLKWCAANKKAYHVVLKDDISRVTASVHHEGIAILAKRKRNLTESELFKSLTQKRQPLVVLDGVENPHNVGAIMRVMAHFGWKHLIYAEKDAVLLSSSAARIGEGGSEIIEIATYKNAKGFLANLKKLDYQTIGTSAHSQKSLYKTKIAYPACAIFLGNERTGLSKDIASKLDMNVSIPGAGYVQSLNVGIAAALFIGECVRVHGVIPKER